jgi:hypothetical protein
MTTDDLRYRCRHCAMMFALVGPRLTDAALHTLREHVRIVHARVGLTADSHAGAILANYDVERAS